ncbi:disease resistance protein RPM1-like [Cornus florida]|uniref:disease resistance protein RPM1-like n=1 Tax=Cornus florida TaxID=4283 RepID=UPI002899A972|nr:disease resistance protein RPM1-like [Cornus florida]
MASATVDLLIGKIVSVLENEASLIGGVDAELKNLKNELGWMSSFLQDFYKKDGLTEVENSWVEEVRGMSYRVENIIDEFMYHMNKQKSGGKFRRLFYKTVGVPNNLLVRHLIATELQDIKRMIKDIPERKQHEDLVGIEANREKLVGWLTDGEPQRTVISVVGMGGLGKSTLVANAYNHGNVKRHFHCFAWITVSQTYDAEDLLRHMIEEFYRASNEAIPMDTSTIRYVIVLDDVLSSDLWKDIKCSLPDEGLESRVLLTTRKEDIASSSFEVKSHILNLKPLENPDAWDLFCMKAFPGHTNQRCPQELENLSCDLAAKCEGLP